jgi:hypothetical protein
MARAVLSHSIRRMQRDGGPRLQIDSELLGQILKERQLPSPSAQADNLIRLIGERQPFADKHAFIDPAEASAVVGTSDVGTDSPTGGFSHVADELHKRKLIERGGDHRGRIMLRLTFDGWNRYEELMRSVETSRTAFMAMKFGDVEADRMFVECFQPAVNRTGFVLQRLDQNPKAGLIDLRMEVAIRTARFLIADLTHGNLGAYWEAGFAAGLGKPVFYTCKAETFKAQSTHFDTNHHHTVLWDATKPEEAAEALKVSIRATLPVEARLKDD